MKQALLSFAVFCLAARLAADVTGQARFSYQQYDYGLLTTSGFRQTYDLNLSRALSESARFSLTFRGDDFRGSAGASGRSSSSETRQIQPAGEFALALGNLQAAARKDYYDIRTAGDGGSGSVRTMDHSVAQLSWTPTGLPTLSLSAQRNVTGDHASTIDLTENTMSASSDYNIQGLTLRADSRYNSARDSIGGYERSSTAGGGVIAYSRSLAHDKFSFGAEFNGQSMSMNQRSFRDAANIPNPVLISKALFGVDDTPADDRDHPLVANPALTDGDATTSAGISLGPDSVAFQNIEVDLGAVNRIDEIRVLVRDPLGNPLRNGGGTVTWDVYKSQDEITWTPVTPASETTFNAPLSAYSVTFNLTNGRYFKIVSFGANIDPAFVTEVEAYYHTTITGGRDYDGSQQLLSGSTSLTYRPMRKLTLSYSGGYVNIEQEFAPLPATSSRQTDHVGGAQYAFTNALAFRLSYVRSDIEAFDGQHDYTNGGTASVDYSPRRQLRFSADFGRQNQSFEGSEFVVDSKALHANAIVIPAVTVNMEIGTQTQTLARDHSTAERQYANLTSHIQLYRTLRLLLTASTQRAETNSDDPATLLLGPSRDNRAAADFMWRPGRPLTVQARIGWTSGQAISGLTERFHIEWQPFRDGTVSIGGTFDEDIDPSTNRRARRAVFSPRWILNDHATLGLNYTLVETSYGSDKRKQNSFFGSLTLTR